MSHRLTQRGVTVTAPADDPGHGAQGRTSPGQQAADQQVDDRRDPPVEQGVLGTGVLAGEVEDAVVAAERPGDASANLMISFTTALSALMLCRSTTSSAPSARIAARTRTRAGSRARTSRTRVWAVGRHASGSRTSATLADRSAPLVRSAGRPSAAFELGLAGTILDEGVHPDGAVLGGEQARRTAGARSPGRCRGRPRGRGRWPPWRPGGRTTRRRANWPAHASASAYTCVGGDDLVDQADRQRLVGLDEPAGEDQVLGPARADQAGQPLGAAGARDDAEQHLGLAERGVVGGDPDVGAQRELAAAAERVAGDRRDDGLGDPGDRGDRGGQPRERLTMSV